MPRDMATSGQLRPFRILKAWSSLGAVPHNPRTMPTYDASLTWCAILLIAIGLDGFLSTILGIVVGVILAVAVLVLAVPALLVIVISAFSGAAGVVNGVLILLGQIQVADIDGGLMDGLLKYGAVGIIVWLVVAAAGIWYQLRDVGQMMDRMAVDRAAYRMS